MEDDILKYMDEKDIAYNLVRGNFSVNDLSRYYKFNNFTNTLDDNECDSMLEFMDEDEIADAITKGILSERELCKWLKYNKEMINHFSRGCV